MKFYLGGLGNLFNNLPLITKAIVEADKLGYDGALMPDHYMWGQREWGRRPDDNTTLETWVTLTYLAAKTERIHLGTLVTPIPFRPPGMLAKMLSTLDILSNGRVVLGVGAGWSREEFEGYSEWDEPRVRVDKTEEGLELMRRLWTEDKVTFKGRYYWAQDAVLEPKPLQKPYPCLMFGGRGDRMLKLAGRYADICFLFTEAPEEYGRAKEKVLGAAKRANRANKIAFMYGSMGSRAPYDAKVYTDKVEKAVEMGANYFLASFPQNEMFNSLGKFAKDIIPSFK